MPLASRSSFEELYDSITTLESKDLQMVILLSHLLLTSKRKKLTNYRTPAQAMGMFSAGLGGHLEELFRLNVADKKPILGALVVNNTTKVPSEGFFAAAIKYGLLSDKSSTSDKLKFWKQQVDAAYKANASSDMKDLFKSLTDAQRKDLEVLLKSESEHVAIS